MAVILVAFGSYSGVFGHTMTAELAFTSLSVIQILRIAFDHFPGILNWAVNAYVSLGRIASYLDQEEVQCMSERLASIPTSSDPQTVISSGLGFDNATLSWDLVKDGNNQTSKLLSATPPLATIQPSLQTKNNDRKNAAENQPLLSASDSQSVSYASLLSTSSKGPKDLVGKKGSFKLSNIDIRFPEGGMTIIAGPTGCGKTSLLLALIGELTLTEGKIRIPADARGHIQNVAYVAQEAWLCNATIRDNILFGELYDKARYEKVINACALKTDLRTLASGDKTMIGERGVTLSGGQKQRVALARAVYSSARYLLIDDCLSAVDAHTAKHIFQKCLLDADGLMKNRTRVLVTHHVNLCSQQV